MSQVWKIGLYQRNQAKTEARCLACTLQPLKIIQTTDGNTKGVIKHTKVHPEYALKLQQLYQKDVAEKNSIDKFIRVLPKGELSSLDKKVLHFVSCTNQPLSIVDEPTFKSLFAAIDREALKGRHHYTDSALPQMYGLVKNEVRKCLADCPVLSFTSDIWSGPTESFISLTAHGIDSMWKRVKYVLCIKHFPGSHNFGTIGNVINRMLEDWGIERQKCHVFLRDEGSNMKKAFEEGGFLHLYSCTMLRINLIVTSSLIPRRR